MAKIGPAKFVNEVKIEAKKVTWPTRQETTVSMIAVFIMVFVSSIFLYFADQIIAYLILLVMGLGR
ncbi:MAG: preprotein translocase subunit SecE [Alphaproteobacteria bacterium]|nr:MAG: preprotein translocase subunit SecE [Alphaproteobacteria bacterium]